MASVMSELINQEFQQRKQNNPCYSLRAFARDLGLHSGTLSSILQDRRKIPIHLVDNLSEKLTSLSSHREILKTELQRAKKAKVKTFKFDKIVDERNAENIVIDGVYFTLLSLFNCSNFRSDIAWIASRLDVTQNKVKEVLGDLVKASLVSVVDGQYKMNKHAHATRDDVSSEVLKRAHEAILSVAANKLRTVEVSKRDFTSIKFPCDPSKMAEAKKEVRKFQRKMMRLTKSDKSTEVYEMAILLFPRTKSEE